jgi:hypothetical protein
MLLLLTFLWVLGTTILYLNNASFLPDKYLLPSFALLTLTTTIYALYISSLQWEKSRVETEFLKEQFNLVVKFSNHVQLNTNAAFPVVERDGKTLMGACTRFTFLNYKEIKTIDNDLFIVQDFPVEVGNRQIFVELMNDYIDHPLFPRRLQSIISELDFTEFYLNINYARAWFEDVHTPSEKQFVLLNGARKECRDKKPLRIPYKEDYLKVADVVDVYRRFNAELDLWFKENKISDTINRNQDVKQKKAIDRCFWRYNR